MSVQGNGRSRKQRRILDGLDPGSGVTREIKGLREISQRDSKGINRCFSVLRGLLFSVLMIAMIQTIESSKTTERLLGFPGLCDSSRSVGLVCNGCIGSSKALVGCVLCVQPEGRIVNHHSHHLRTGIVHVTPTLANTHAHS